MTILMHLSHLLLEIILLPSYFFTSQSLSFHHNHLQSALSIFIFTLYLRSLYFICESLIYAVLNASDEVISKLKSYCREAAATSR